MHCTELHCTALHCTALHCTALHCTALRCIAFCTAMHCNSLKTHFTQMREGLVECWTTLKDKVEFAENGEDNFISEENLLNVGGTNLPFHNTRHTADGHCNLETKPSPEADSVKMFNWNKSRPKKVSQLCRKQDFFLPVQRHGITSKSH